MWKRLFGRHAPEAPPGGDVVRAGPAPDGRLGPEPPGSGGPRRVGGRGDRDVPREAGPVEARAGGRALRWRALVGGGRPLGRRARRRRRVARRLHRPAARDGRARGRCGPGRTGGAPLHPARRAHGAGRIGHHRREAPREDGVARRPSPRSAPGGSLGRRRAPECRGLHRKADALRRRRSTSRRETTRPSRSPSPTPGSSCVSGSARRVRSPAAVSGRGGRGERRGRPRSSETRARDRRSPRE